tara:strand:- start:1013 stop:1690 length:678 start_codon:yes stop_codon:yes gene_type:complete
MKTNIDGHHETYETYQVNNTSNTMTIDYNKLRLPTNTLLMSDLVPIEMKYFPEPTVDYLKTVTQTDKFVKVLSEKLNDYKKTNRKEYKTSRAAAEEQKIPYYNIVNILERIFKQGNPFFYDKNRTHTVLNYFWNKDYNINVEIINTTEFHIYQIHINVEIDIRSPDQISSEEMKEFSCKTQNEKIKRIWNSLRNITPSIPHAKIISLPRAPPLHTKNISVGGNDV